MALSNLAGSRNQILNSGEIDPIPGPRSMTPTSLFLKPQHHCQNQLPYPEDTPKARS